MSYHKKTIISESDRLIPYMRVVEQEKIYNRVFSISPFGIQVMHA